MRALALLATALLSLACANNRTTAITSPGSTESSPPAAEPAPAPPAPPATGPSAAPASGRNQVLVYTRTTGFRHASIERAAETIRQALTAAGWNVSVSDDPARFAPPALAGLAGIVLVSTTGKPIGEEAQASLAALESWLKAGGALVGLHAASSTQYDPALPYIRLIGGKFINHPGSVRPAACHPEGSHPAVARLPTPFPVRDEIYRFEQLRPDNNVILRCDAFQGTDRLPIAWHRQEGTGRVFYSALGHSPEDFAPESAVWKDHMLPGILWALAR
jgi:type 1 glutamine amidotransferase